MKKLRLDLEALSVESFSTADKRLERGTVRGHDSTDTGSECQTYLESCVVTACCSYDGGCYSNGGGRPCHPPITP